jgi:hypothetical protein
MGVRVVCPSCGKAGQVPVDYEGCKVTCKGCKSSFVIQPELEAEAIEEEVPLLEEEVPELEELEVEEVEEGPQRIRRRRERRRIIARGITGEVELLANSVVIRRKGFRAWLVQGARGDKEILLRSITGIDFKEGTGWYNRGYIRFLFPGSTDKHGAPLWDYTSARMRRDLSHDENTVVFNVGSREEFRCFKEAVECRLGQSRSGVSGGVSVADELQKLANLLDRGLLTKREFEQKKRDLLDG